MGDRLGIPGAVDFLLFIFLGLISLSFLIRLILGTRSNVKISCGALYFVAAWNQRGAGKRWAFFSFAVPEKRYIHVDAQVTRHMSRDDHKPVLPLGCDRVYKRCSVAVKCLRPYHVENTGSRPITEVKQRRARSVLGWVTAWEYRVQ